MRKLIIVKIASGDLYARGSGPGPANASAPGSGPPAGPGATPQKAANDYAGYNSAYSYQQVCQITN